VIRLGFVRLSTLFVGTILLLAVAGCGGAGVPTAGVVRFEDGTPVTSGSIEFRRLSDKARFASRISPQGMFQPANQDGDIGLPAGAYEVVVLWTAGHDRHLWHVAGASRSDPDWVHG
jgi:hypothetical protein